MSDIKYFVFFNKETGVAENMMYTNTPEVVKYSVMEHQVAVEVEDSHGWEHLTLQDVNREQTEEDAHG